MVRVIEKLGQKFPARGCSLDVFQALLCVWQGREATTVEDTCTYFSCEESSEHDEEAAGSEN
eukprot:2433417-Amphidinium_carterae.1